LITTPFIVYILKEVELYYAFHKNTDDNVIEYMNKALLGLKKPDIDGNSVFKRIKENYLNAESSID